LGDLSEDCQDHVMGYPNDPTDVHRERCAQRPVELLYRMIRADARPL